MNAKISTPRERPIVMSAPMVVATLKGRKTQTRRVITPQPPESVGRIYVNHYEPAIVVDGETQPGPEIFGAYDEDGEWGVRCPYGAPGDRLWVRETWAGHESDDDISPSRMPAAWKGSLASAPPVWYAATETDHRGRGRWRPSIHMPRWASRITLAITSVRIERLNDITEDDARAEGVACDADGWWLGPPDREHPAGLAMGNARAAFERWWGHINGKRPGCAWLDNPHVWVIAFEMIGGGT